MNASGKSVLAIAALAGILGIGWWVLNLVPHPDARDQTRRDGVLAESQIQDAWLVETDAMIRLVSDLLVAGNVAGASALLDIMDARVARQQPQSALEPLRRALATDRERLASARSLDLVGAASRLDAILRDIDTLPSIATTEPLASGSATPPAPVDPSASFWERALSGIESRLLQVVRIRRIDGADSVMLSPSEAGLLAERLRLRILSARMALLARQESIFVQDLDQASALFGRVFDTADPRVKEHLATMDALKPLAARLTLSATLQSSAVIADLRQQALTAGRP